MDNSPTQQEVPKLKEQKSNQAKSILFQNQISPLTSSTSDSANNSQNVNPDHHEHDGNFILKENSSSSDSAYADTSRVEQAALATLTCSMDPYQISWINAQQQYQQAIQFALQNPKLGPLQWPGGFHPQHTHALTYSKIFVGGLKRDTDRKTLIRHFSKFGSIKRVDLVMDPRSPTKNRGFAFVQFEHIDGCERACKKGQFHNIDGHDVEVKRAVLKPPGSGNETAGIDPTAYGYGMMQQYYQGQPVDVNGNAYFNPQDQVGNTFDNSNQNYNMRYGVTPMTQAHPMLQSNNLYNNTITSPTNASRNMSTSSKQQPEFSTNHSEDEMENGADFTSTTAPIKSCTKQNSIESGVQINENKNFMRLSNIVYPCGHGSNFGNVVQNRENQGAGDFNSTYSDNQVPDGVYGMNNVGIYPPVPQAVLQGLPNVVYDPNYHPQTYYYCNHQVQNNFSNVNQDYSETASLSVTQNGKDDKVSNSPTFSLGELPATPDTRQSNRIQLHKRMNKKETV